MSRRTRSDGERSRELILDAAARLATVEGLDGLSLGRIARETGMSKSGVFGLFGSKEELQLATIDKAREVFVEAVVRPALSVPRGRERLVALADRYLDYVEGGLWPGGCFFASVASELGARPGPARDRIALEQLKWVGLLVESARQAAGMGELPPDAEPEQVALEVGLMLTGADIQFLLHGDAELIARTRTAVRARCGYSSASRRNQK